jgi:hypothetical protein
VLNKLIDRNPAPEYLKDILIANSALSNSIKERINSLQIPNGIKQQISIVQNGVNPRKAAADEIDYYSSQIDELEEILLSAYTKNDESLQELKLLLEKINTVPSKKELLSIYLQENNSLRVSELTSDLVAAGISLEFINFATLQNQINQYSDLNQALNNELIYQELISFSASSDNSTKAKAKSYLEFIEKRQEADYFIVPIIVRSSTPIQNSDINITYDLNVAKIYPNPNTGKIYNRLA